MSTETVNKPEEVAAKAPTITYELDGERVTRTDKEGSIHVANLSKIGGKLTLALVEEHARFRPAIVRHLNEQELSPEAIIIAGSEAQAAKENARTDIPPKPQKSRVHGDKTPELVEWYRKYKPNEYAARYGIIGPGTVTKSRKVLGEDGKPTTELYDVDALIAQRKTHLTEKPEANISGDQEYKD